ncbi:MAG: patatin-like phospholipase family protein [Candidatus Berkiella sp.]
MRKLLTLVLVLTNINFAFANDHHRPKVGLVLSGGGARGAAHIGVIEALEEMQVPIDFIVGTSMGAVIGGLYASGVPIQTIKSNFSSLNWDDIFSLNIKRTDLYYRRKLDSDIFILKNFISYSHGQIHIPSGLITGQTLYEVFNHYLLHEEPIKNFDRLSIPFKAVSTDLITGNPVILEDGDLALSLLASMAVPGIISPIDMKNYLLVDGGVSDNLPVDIAKSMGADVLIVVNVSTPLSTKAEIIDLTSVLGQITNILTSINEKHSESMLTANDVVIVPNLNHADTSDFSKFSQLIIPGKLAAYQHRHALMALSSRSNAYPRHDSSDELIRIDEVRIEGESTLLADTYFHYLDFDSLYVPPQEIEDKINKLYGLSVFDRIYYGIESTPQGQSLTVKPQKVTNDPIYFQGSLLLDTNFNSTNNFGLVLGVTNQQINSYMGEWRVLANIGYGEKLFAELYQPFTGDLAWFINPSASLSRTPVTYYFDYDPQALYLDTAGTFTFALGKNFSNWSRLSAFWQFQNSDLKRRTGPDLVQSEHINDGQLGLNFEWDTIDNAYFPHHGLRGHISLSSFDQDFGGDDNFSQLEISNLGALSCGKHSFALGTVYNRTLDNTPSVTQRYFLGGLYELTGLNTQELYGDNSALITAIYYYQWKNLHVIPNRPLPIYVGASLEKGKVWGNPNLSQNRFIGSGSVFIGADSILGPIYFSVGATDTGHQAVHLTLRPVFR